MGNMNYALYINGKFQDRIIYIPDLDDWLDTIVNLFDPNEIKIIFRGQLIENYDWTEKSIDIITDHSIVI